MKKIKKIFVTPNDENTKQIKQNQKEKCVKPDIISINHEKNDKQKHSMQDRCPHCQENGHLIEKYELLIKLLKIKIMKLEKQIEIQHQNGNADKINQFQDFTMDLDTASLQTLKNFTQKNFSPFKVLKFDPNLKADKNQKSFDKTVLKFEKTGKVKSAKQLKDILDDFRICPQDIQNEIYPHSKTSKQIKKRLNKVFSCEKMSDEFGKQISFIKLMQKSEFSINNSKHIIFEQYSTIKRSGSIEKCTSIDFDELKVNQDKIKQENKDEKKLRILAQRIQFLTETVIDLKSLLMHVRHSIFQLTKMTDIQHLRKHEPSSYEMLKIIMRIFEFSEDEMQEIINSKNKKKQQKKLHNFFFSSLAR